jgi:hypothetical protein
MVIVLATEPKFRGLKPGLERWIFKGDKQRQHHFLRRVSKAVGPPVPIVQEGGRAPEPVWTQKLEENSFRLCRGSNLDRPVFQYVVRLYTD